MSEEWRQQLLTSLAIQFNEVKYPLYVQSILNLKYYAPLKYKAMHNQIHTFAKRLRISAKSLLLQAKKLRNSE